MTLRVGTRGSALALTQAGTVADALGDAELIPIRTSGDEGGVSAARNDDKSRFVREIERALIDGEIDLAVHSAKDVPGEIPEEIRLVGVPPREDPADAWIGEAGSLAEIPAGARVGTASLRRRAQLLTLRPDLDIVELRGNVDTRIKRLAERELDGIVLAAAGLQRLGRDGEISFRFGLDELTPAPGQGSLALQARTGSAADAAAARAAAITDREALIELTAERAAVAGLEASCETPVGVCARHDQARGVLVLRGFAGMPSGTESIAERVEGDPSQPVALGEALVKRMADRGVHELLLLASSGLG